MQSPFFSVIIPTYNRKEFLKKAINSVLEQTEKDWELLIVDDGSSDGSQPLKEEIAKEEIAKEEIAKEEIAKEEIAKEEIAKEEIKTTKYLKKNIFIKTSKISNTFEFYTNAEGVIKQNFSDSFLKNIT